MDSALEEVETEAILGQEKWTPEQTTDKTAMRDLMSQYKIPDHVKANIKS